MPRIHGYSQRGQRCWGQHDWGARGRINAIGALLGAVLLTVCLFEQTINTAVFEAWLEHDLLPKLPPKSVVVMDNASFHKSERLRSLLQQNGHILAFLPPYSPDLNPIEHKWAQAKSIRKKQRCSIPQLFLSNKL